AYRSPGPGRRSAVPRLLRGSPVNLSATRMNVSADQPTASVHRGGMDMKNDHRKLDTLRQVLDGFNRHDLDAIMAHFADDCVFESPRGPDPWGRRFVGKDE